ncbi:hypothetical protein CHL67_07185 [Prosthecochloris sp. GSB1]|uniref:hypothetical protein n=1 Tax=Prosthecochloris sp. GSB1 TaxID=281093 RepID=UPI000B8D1193|nr:hypothetical protein [Prosthecochloris sp. GSB1]ASQ90737.1 hypothetical protein CHL67_07185 [Prosthecochloris sp. GSB1]
MTTMLKVIKNAGKAVLLLPPLFLFLSLHGPDVEAKDKETRKKLESTASDEVQKTYRWIEKERDNRKLPFAIIDKKNAHIYVFDDKGKIIDTGPVLLGIAKNDQIDPKTLKKPLSSIGKEDRVTPSGRFQSVIGPDHRGKQVLWVDPQFAIALHPVVNVPGQNRFTRIESSSADDNRITWGCINVPVPLFKKVITPLFKPKSGFVYILPESDSVEKLLAQNEKND